MALIMSVNLEWEFNVPAQLIYEALIDQTRVMQYTRAKAEVVPREGGTFSLLQGKILGKYLVMRPNQYLKMQWKFNDWKQYSLVEIIFESEEEDECVVRLTHTSIPPNEKKEKIEFGWKQHIFTPLSKILGYPFRN